MQVMSVELRYLVDAPGHSDCDAQGNDTAGENFGGESVFQIGAEIPPAIFFFAQSAPFLAPWVGSSQFSSAARSWCPCIACQDQCLCECVSQNFSLVYPEE